MAEPSNTNRNLAINIQQQLSNSHYLTDTVVRAELGIATLDAVVRADIAGLDTEEFDTDVRADGTAELGTAHAVRALALTPIHPRGLEFWRAHLNKTSLCRNVPDLDIVRFSQDRTPTNIKKRK